MGGGGKKGRQREQMCVMLAAWRDVRARREACEGHPRHEKPVHTLPIKGTHHITHITFNALTRPLISTRSGPCTSASRAT